MAKNTATFTDLPAKNDLFGLNPYIEGLAKFIGMCSTPLTIAIQGDWGSGKTSMMEMTREKLDTKIYPVWFNTWQYSQFNLDSELTVSFMREIVESIGAKGEVRKGFDKALNSIGSIARNAVTLAADRFLGEKIGAAVGNAMDCLNQSSPTYAALEVKNLRAEFEKCVNFALKARNKEKLVIFVDDLDRLNPSRAVELLEVLKNYLDCEKCVFILAVDSSVIFQGVREKYSSDITPKKAKSFFDKIIQVPFKMPIDIYDIKNYVKKLTKLL
ncbi:P-loop NTPase fold protein [uncultured Campylobacter sp.]|uniref:KAP family P-loop NTPase fold protein n=1 Tax=uncultured Campylobacter sp. TaxID=218934 RepID=UPI002636517E|nr:P-loop NTPase fold protein [uncultured Campylobacter sp.]